MKINWPKIRIDIPSPIKDLERLTRQLGISQGIEESVIEQLAQQLAGGSIPVWQLRDLARVCSRAATLKES